MNFENINLGMGEVIMLKDNSANMDVDGGCQCECEVKCDSCECDDKDIGKRLDEGMNIVMVGDKAGLGGMDVDKDKEGEIDNGKILNDGCVCSCEVKCVDKLGDGANLNEIDVDKSVDDNSSGLCNSEKDCSCEVKCDGGFDR